MFGGQAGLWTLHGSAVFFSGYKKNVFFTSLGTWFNLFLYTAAWIEKVHFLEEHTESNSLIESW